MTPPVPVLRAPMVARDRDLAPGAGAAFGLARGVVGTGDALDVVPATIDEAVAAAADRHGEKAGRMLRRFAAHDDGTFVWTRPDDGSYRLGRLSGPWHYDDSPDAREVGIHHVRPATWLPRRFDEDEVPAAVAATFARGGRNLQRTHDADAERRTAELWDAHAGDA
ncbi:hypothetical protein [Patulibacter minatonensis]|uniref:hypothetical protein n=1 Tax=Patulibacter minatonensis TaxID=298163 RepID=UPI00047C5C74|nr:hypothetical protein [Patulibacter minatonensis]